MQTLPSSFRSDGFDFSLVKRSGDVALFQKSKPGHVRPTYEVVIIQKHPAETIRGRSYPEREAMPSSEQWGTFGWTPPPDPDSANVAFNRAVAACGSLP